jgi:chromosome segregation ATPase
MQLPHHMLLSPESDNHLPLCPLHAPRKQEGESYEVVPGSQFSVTRSAHRSNQSDYYLNDRKVAVKEVTEKLKTKGIDLDNNRFLILQVREPREIGP